MKKFGSFILFLLVFTMLSGVVFANTVDSSTMVFQGELTQNSDGSFSGTIAATQGTYYVVDGEGSSVSTSGGFDVYARNDAWATYYGSDSYLEGTILSNDAYTTEGGWGSVYNPDVGDWYNYQLRFDSGNWYLEYNANVGNDGNFDGASASPMSGSVDWINYYASEIGTGVYYEGMGVPKNDSYASQFATDNGLSTEGAWDMDWSWGSDYVPLEYPGFDMNIMPVDGEENTFIVTMVPAPLPVEYPVVYVNDDDLTCEGQTPCYATIHEALDEVEDDGTIYVQEGTYTENVILDKPVNLIGAGNENTTIDGGNSGSVITISSDDVTVQDLTIQNSGKDDTQGDAGIKLVSVSGATLTDNIIQSNLNGIGLITTSNSTLSRNTITSNIAYGIALVASSSNTINSNTISSNDLDAIALDNANVIGGDVGIGSLSNTIQSNTISSNRDAIFVGENCDSNIITSNTISSALAVGIHLWKSNSNIVNSNDITNTESAIRFLHSSSNTISSNDIHGNTYGLKFEASAEGNSENNNINNNILLGNTNTIVNNEVIEKDLSSNYWGTISEDEIESMVSGDVDFKPWCSDETCSASIEGSAEEIGFSNSWDGFLGSTVKDALDWLYTQLDAKLEESDLGDYFQKDSDNMDDITDGSTYVKTHNDYTDSDKNKLSNIEDGAQANVKSDWTATDGDAEILNKPTIPTSLDDLSEDSTHRVVTDSEKTAWNAKSEFSGDYDDLSDRPDLTIYAEKTNHFTKSELNAFTGSDSEWGASKIGFSMWNGLEGLENNTVATALDFLESTKITYNEMEDSNEIDFTHTFDESEQTHSITASIMTGSIAKSKLDSGVQDLLDLADSALQAEDINSETKLEAIANVDLASEDELSDAVSGLASETYVTSAVSSEASIARTNETALSTRLDSLEEDPVTKTYVDENASEQAEDIAALSEGLSDEVETRTQADSKLQNSIDDLDERALQNTFGFDIYLTQGWNEFKLPWFVLSGTQQVPELDVENYSVEVVLADIIDEVEYLAYYDGSDWQTYIPDEENATSFTEFPSEAGTPDFVYHIYMTEGARLSVSVMR
jgi:nitrous oxidase accessory protein